MQIPEWMRPIILRIEQLTGSRAHPAFYNDPETGEMCWAILVDYCPMTAKALVEELQRSTPIMYGERVKIICRQTLGRRF